MPDTYHRPRGSFAGGWLARCSCRRTPERSRFLLVAAENTDYPIGALGSRGRVGDFCTFPCRSRRDLKITKASAQPCVKGLRIAVISRSSRRRFMRSLCSWAFAFGSNGFLATLTLLMNHPGRAAVNTVLQSNVCPCRRGPLGPGTFISCLLSVI